MGLKWKIPGPDAKGYLKRQRKAYEFFETGEMGAQWFDNLIEFLLPFVDTPRDRSKAREALWDMSEKEYKEALDLIAGRQGEVSPNN